MNARLRCHALIRRLGFTVPAAPVSRQGRQANAMVNTRSNPWHVRPSHEIKTRSLLVVLHRWAGIVGIRAEDAAVTRLWTQGSSTTGTLIDNDSRIGWYGRCLCLMAIWAVDAGDAFHDSSLTARLLSMEIIHVAST